MKEPDYAAIAILVRACRQGDQEAFGKLYAMTKNKTYQYCTHYLRDSYLAQDAMQEIYISALKNIGKLTDDTLFIAWLSQISFHVCYDMRKKHDRNYNTVDIDALSFLLEDERTDRNPEKAVLRKIEERDLQKAIRLLPANEQQVIVLRYYNNMKLKEIAAMLRISLSSTKRYLLRAQKNLRQKLAS